LLQATQSHNNKSKQGNGWALKWPPQWPVPFVLYKTKTLPGPCFFANVIEGDSEQNTNSGEYSRGKWIISNTVSRHVDGITV